MNVKLENERPSFFMLDILTIDCKLNPRLASSYAAALNSSQLMSPTMSQGALEETMQKLR